MQVLSKEKEIERIQQSIGGLVRMAIEADQTTKFGVEFEYGYAGNAIEFRIYKDKAIPSEPALLWESIRLHGGVLSEEAESKIETALFNILTKGKFSIEQ